MMRKLKENCEGSILWFVIAVLLISSMGLLYSNTYGGEDYVFEPPIFEEVDQTTADEVEDHIDDIQFGENMSLWEKTVWLSARAGFHVYNWFLNLFPESVQDTLFGSAEWTRDVLVTGGAFIVWFGGVAALDFEPLNTIGALGYIIKFGVWSVLAFGFVRLVRGIG